MFLRAETFSYFLPFFLAFTLSFSALPALKEGALDVLIAPINGAYGNLNEQENVTLTKALQPMLTVPCHFGMFASHGGHPGLWKDLIEQQLPEQQFKIFTMGEGIEI